MIPNVQTLLRRYKVTTLRELSKKSGVSLNKLKNISSSRTSFEQLFVKRTQHRITPRHSKELAELIGIVLGDGNIYQFDRCQRLTISCNSSYGQYVKHVNCLVAKIFKKRPSIIKRSLVNCVDIYLYSQDIDKALGLPLGNKIQNSVEIPLWIFKNKYFLIKCLKGLFETDGHYGLNRKSYVEYMQFCNKSESLKKSVFKALKLLKYSPQMGSSYVRLAKKAEVHRFVNLIGLERPFPALVN